jgi:hypothetical protein
MTLQTRADITGADAKVVLGVAGSRARVIWITATTGIARFGDINVSSSRGVVIPGGTVPAEFIAPQNGADQSDSYHLDLCYVYVPSGTVVSITFGT